MKEYKEYKDNKKNDNAQTEQAAERAPVFQSDYSELVKENLNKAINREPFKYDVNEDKLFAKYKDNYESAGKKAMADTVGNAALLTGGYGNSYGVTAGQHAYNEYMSKLSDKVPELEQLAYNRYKAEEDAAYERLKTLMSLDNTDYNRFRDDMADYKNERDFNYQRYMDELSQKNIDRQFERDVYEDDRRFLFDVENGGKKSDKDKDKEDDGNFHPEDAYAFINKYNDAIYTDEEFVQALYQMYGDREGFYDWLAKVQIPGDVEERSYLQLLYQMYPRLRSSYEKPSDSDLMYKTATNGGATIPHSLGLWALQRNY